MILLEIVESHSKYTKELKSDVEAITSQLLETLKYQTGSKGSSGGLSSSKEAPKKIAIKNEPTTKIVRIKGDSNEEE